MISFYSRLQPNGGSQLSIRSSSLGMHNLMYYVDSIVTLMASNGLSEFLKVVTGGYKKLFKGKTFLKIHIPTALF